MKLIICILFLFTPFFVMAGANNSHPVGQNSYFLGSGGGYSGGGIGFAGNYHPGGGGGTMMGYSAQQVQSAQPNMGSGIPGSLRAPDNFLRDLIPQSIQQIQNPCRGCSNRNCNSDFVANYFVQNSPNLFQPWQRHNLATAMYTHWGKSVSQGQPNHTFIPRPKVVTQTPQPIQAPTPTQVEPEPPQNEPESTLIDPNTIEDPASIPYAFRSEEGSYRNALERQYKDLYKISPVGETRQASREFGLIATEQADQAYSTGSNEADFYRELGKGFLDIAVGIDPITGVGRSGYELLTGKNLITGAELSRFERSMAFVNLVTANGGRYVNLAGKGISRVYAGASHLIQNKALQRAIRSGETSVYNSRNILRGWSRNHRIDRIERASEANERFREGLRTTSDYMPPYREGTHVVHFTPTRDTSFIRVSTERHPSGSWMIKRGEIRGMTPEQIRSHLNLPSTPTHFGRVDIPAGTRMSRGMTNGNYWDGITEVIEGQVQYRIEGQWEHSWFSHREPLGDIFR